jgi:hypothetical protein
MTMTNKAGASGALTEAELCNWLGNALPKDRLTYHRGFLAVDCDPGTSRLSPTERTALRLVADRARRAEAMGVACLVQTRHGPNDYSYVIIARVRPKPSPSAEPGIAARHDSLVIA